MSYGDSLDWLTQGWNQGIYSKEDKLIVVDFSFKRNTMESLFRMFPLMLVLDHHKTAQAECEGLDFCIFDMNESGASLAWKYFFPEMELPWLVRYIKDRDLWKFEEEHSEAVNAYIQSFPMEISQYYKLEQELEDEEEFDRAVENGQSINRYKQTMVEAICKMAAGNTSYPFYDSSIPIVNTSLLFSEVGYELCKLYPNAHFAAYYYDRVSNNVRQWGLRSIGDFDVSAIAKQFGGGGHKNAAGFEQKLSEI